MSGSLARIGAMTLRYCYLLRSSWPRLLELIYWPAMQMLVWGFLQLYLSEESVVACHDFRNICWRRPTLGCVVSRPARLLDLVYGRDLVA